ncbi:hypothetical protein Poli38472_014253 [Pythium oligandrum]|uniref:BZIP domain-containing protein n=1 Tax=Pythium oligandrum TaxID=41045 RepID=A0A8K1CK16_PYTOL|nr:hypothetical protein Poli38472_014253 [Pythium oligandrum]|eukprot:TMW64136.1 hypothetical protein Poli38472_014253 [Pythium oligandrum]
METPPPPPPSLPVQRVAPLSAEEKQERQRMHVRRSYYKKRNFVQSLRDQVTELEKQYADALANQDESSPAQVSPPSPTGGLGLMTSPAHTFEYLADVDLGGSSPNIPASNEAVQLFMQLSQLRDTLRHENDELKKTLVRCANFVRRVQQCAEDAEQEAQDETHHHVDTLGFHITTQECIQIDIAVYEDIKSVLQNEDYVSTGVSLFGWSDRRHVDEGFVRFSVKKFYSDLSALELSDATWDLLTSPSRFMTIYSPSLHIDMRMIQRVDDDNVVYYRRITRPEDGTVTKSIFLLSRFRTESGYVVLFHSCNHDRYRHEQRLLRAIDMEGGAGEDDDVPMEANENWHDIYTWLMFEEVGEMHQSTQFTFGGRVDTRAATPQFWMLEILLMSLRWEAIVIGPTFALCQG